MGFKLRLIGSIFGRFLSSLPSCIKDVTIAWWKNFNSIINVDGTDYVEESIGTRIDTVYYGQYLTVSSGQINFYRTTGTFSYIDPSDGSTVSDVSMPVDGLFTIPANGICEITVSDGSWYPICERAGSVLHDVDANEIHISVSTPDWDETLYGSDYLNQYGYLDKETSDALGYSWETNVNGTPITLDENCLIPISQWNYGYLYDVNEQQIFDVNDEPIELKV